MRGPDAVERWMHIPVIEVKVLCDHERDRAEACQKILMDASMPVADIYYGEDGYKELCSRNDIDLVDIATDGLYHYLIAREALDHGLHVTMGSHHKTDSYWTVCLCTQSHDYGRCSDSRQGDFYAGLISYRHLGDRVSHYQHVLPSIV